MSSGPGGYADPICGCGHAPLKIIFGEVTVSRMGYSAHDAETLFPRDAELNLPPELYSHGLARSWRCRRTARAS